MSETLIASLQQQVDRLTSDNATLRAEAKQRRHKAKGLGEENETLRTQLATVTTERDTFKSSLDAKPGELQAKIDSLQGKLRDRDHKDAFRSLAKAAGVNEAAIEDAWIISGYKPEGDELDETKIKAAIGSTLQGRDWLKAAPAAESATGSPGAPGTTPAQRAVPANLPQGPGANRGGAAGTTDPEKQLEAQYPDAFRLA